MGPDWPAGGSSAQFGFSTVRMADLIIVVADGKVMEAGPHATLMRNCGLYAELYALQAAAYG